MRTRVIIFDIYNTLLQVGAAPPDAEVRWLRLCRSLGKETTVLSLAEFDAKCREAIARDHAAAKARGVAFPEVFWPEITCTVLPQLKGLSPDSLDDFLYEHAQLQRTVQLMPGAGEALRTLHQQGTVLGLCSNSQPYTLRELAQALAQVRLTMEIFDPRLCFYSFRAGFSKPNLKAFEQLQQVLTGLSVSPVEVTFVGDRLDNDILPAQSVGWETWHLSLSSKEAGGGDWLRFLQTVCRTALP